MTVPFLYTLPKGPHHVETIWSLFWHHTCKPILRKKTSNTLAAQHNYSLKHKTTPFGISFMDNPPAPMCTTLVLFFPYTQILTLCIKTFLFSHLISKPTSVRRLDSPTHASILFNHSFPKTFNLLIIDNHI